MEVSPGINLEHAGNDSPVLTPKKLQMSPIIVCKKARRYVCPVGRPPPQHTPLVCFMYACRKVSATTIAVAFPVGRPEVLGPSAAKDGQESMPDLEVPTEPPAGQVYAFLPINGAIFGLPFELQAHACLPSTASQSAPRAAVFSSFCSLKGVTAKPQTCQLSARVCMPAGGLAADCKPRVPADQLQLEPAAAGGAA
eukprot:1134250-Pelagomonas_calceolata.AAC.17